jgi:hypothetical protein
MTQEAELPKHYYLDESDSDIVALHRVTVPSWPLSARGEPRKKDS